MVAIEGGSHNNESVYGSHNDESVYGSHNDERCYAVGVMVMHAT